MPSRLEKDPQLIDQEGAWTASSVRTRWRDIVADANTKGEVVVTHHNRAEVVVVSLPHFEELKRKAKASDTLAALRAEFDDEMAVLLQPDAAEKLRRLSDVTPEEIARAANAEAAHRKR